MGRRRIVIERIKDSDKRYVTFTKRRDGLFKKADTACRMYDGSQIAIVVFSPTAGKLHSFGPVDSLIEQFLHTSSSSSSYLNLEEENVVIGTTTTTTATTTGDHIEDGKKRSRSGDDDDDDRVPMMPEERETKKRKLLMSTTTTEAAATTVEEEEKEFKGFEQNVTQSRREETDIVDYNIMGSSSSTTAMTTSLVASSSSFLESDQDHDELDEYLNGFADYIIAADDHPYEETMFDLLPHQGVYDDVGFFTFCDNWPSLQ